MSKMDKMQMILDLNTQLQLSYPPNKQKMKECWTPETMVLPPSQLPLLPSAQADSWLSPNLLRPFYSIQDNMREFWYPNKDDEQSRPPSSTGKPPPPDPYKKRMTMLLIAGIFLLIIIFVIVVLIYVRYTKIDNHQHFSPTSGNQSIMFTNSTDKNTKNEKRHNFTDDYRELVLLKYKILTEDLKKLQEEVEKYKGEVWKLQLLNEQCKKGVNPTQRAPSYISTIKPQKDEEVPFYYTSKPPKNFDQGGRGSAEELSTTVKTTERASTTTITNINGVTINKIAHNDMKATTLVPESPTPTPSSGTTQVKYVETTKPTNLETATEINEKGRDPNKNTTVSTLDGGRNGEIPNKDKQDGDLQNKNENKNKGTDDEKNNVDKNESDPAIDINGRNKTMMTERYQNYDFTTPIPIKTTPDAISSTNYNVVTEIEREFGENVVLPTKIPKIQDQKRDTEEKNDGPSNTEDSQALQNNDKNLQNSDDLAEKKNDRKGRGIQPNGRNSSTESPKTTNGEITNEVDDQNQADSGNANNGGGNTSDNLPKQETNKNNTKEFKSNDEKENLPKPADDGKGGDNNNDKKNPAENESKYDSAENDTKGRKNDETKQNPNGESKPIIPNDKTKVNSNDETKPNPNDKNKPNLNGESQPNPNGESQPNPNGESQPNPNGENKPNRNGENKPNRNGENKLNPNGESQPNPNGESQPNPNGESQPNPNGESQPNPNGESQPNPNGESQPNPNGESQPNPNGESQPNPNGESQPNPNGESKPNPNDEETKQNQNGEINKADGKMGSPKSDLPDKINETKPIDNTKTNEPGVPTQSDKKESSEDTMNKNQSVNTKKGGNQGNSDNKEVNGKSNSDNKEKSENDSKSKTKLKDLTADKAEKDKNVSNDGKKKDDDTQKNENVVYERPKKKGKGKDNEPENKEKENEQKNRNNDDKPKQSDDANSNEDGSEDVGSVETNSEPTESPEKKENQKKKCKKDKKNDAEPRENGGTTKPTPTDLDNDKKPLHKDAGTNLDEKGKTIPVQNTTNGDSFDENKYTAHWNHYKKAPEKNQTGNDVMCKNTKKFPFSHLNNSCYLNFTECPAQLATTETNQKLESPFQYNTMCILLLLDTKSNPMNAIMPRGHSNYILSVAGKRSGTFSLFICSGDNILLRVEISELGDRGKETRIIFSSNVKKHHKKSRHPVLSEEVHQVKVSSRGEFTMVIFSGKDYYNIYYNHFGGSPLKYKHRLKEENGVRIKFRGEVSVSVLTFEVY